MKIVFTGGAHAGKTTALNAFKSKGFTGVPEAGMLVIDDLKENAKI